MTHPDDQVRPPADDVATLRPATGARPSKPRLAIVSPYGELCGIAAYTHFLSEQLSEDFSVEIVAIDEYLTRSRHPALRRKADDHIADICRRLAKFDCVNIQLEHGTLGSAARDIVRRFARIVDAAPALSVTFHTIIQEPALDLRHIVRLLLRLRFVQATQDVQGYLAHRALSRDVLASLREAERRKPVSIIVHTRREHRLMTDVYGFEYVFDHPLAFLSADAAASIRTASSRASFSNLASLPGDARLIGVFGFLSRYKNVGNVIQALRLLPENYHLLIFGGVNPKSIRERTPVDDYLDEVLKEIVRRPRGAAGKTAGAEASPEGNEETGVETGDTRKGAAASHSGLTP